MMRYSMNINKDSIALAQAKDIDASYKDLAAVCDAIRYLKLNLALDVLDGVITMQKAIPFKRYNTHMGSRHELAGRKGAYPVKAAKEVGKVLFNAVANSKSKGLDEDSLYVVHASANKTQINRRSPSKGSLSWGRGMYGLSARTHSDLEYAKIEIGVANPDAGGLTGNMKYFIKVRNKVRESKAKPVEKPAAKKQKQQVAAAVKK